MRSIYRTRRPGQSRGKLYFYKHSRHSPRPSLRPAAPAAFRSVHISTRPAPSLRPAAPLSEASTSAPVSGSDKTTGKASPEDTLRRHRARTYAAGWGPWRGRWASLIDLQRPSSPRGTSSSRFLCREEPWVTVTEGPERATRSSFPPAVDRRESRGSTPTTHLVYSAVVARGDDQACPVGVHAVCGLSAHDCGANQKKIPRCEKKTGGA